MDLKFFEFLEHLIETFFDKLTPFEKTGSIGKTCFPGKSDN